MSTGPALLSLALALSLSGCAGGDLNTQHAAAKQWIDLGLQVAKQANGSQEVDAAAGLREALGLGAQRAAATLAKPGGYLKDPLVHIGLPEPLQPVAKTLRAVGLGKYVDELENDMNVSAEIAAAKAAPIFRQAVTNMSVKDALVIVQGDDTAATRYFRQQTEGQLLAAFRPAIQDGLRRTGYYDSYRALLDKYNALPLAQKPNLDLEQHVLDRAMDGLFLKLAGEERAIRTDPAKRTTALLKKVFGAPPG
ncbi:MAG: DUF4197 domain-containing protein [Actinomycetota bacterium]|nr:DUF4197 domain-containing protein [Actinomycetota bacterium]